jgi:hypothetical protein
MNNAVLVAETAAEDKPKKRLIDQVRDVMRLKHYSLRTEQTYWDWIQRFIRFHGMRHPREMAQAEVAGFLTHLAREGRDKIDADSQAFIRGAAKANENWKNVRNKGRTLFSLSRLSGWGGWK